MIGSGWFYEKLKGTGVLEQYHSQGKLKKTIDMLREVKHSHTRRVNGKKLLYLRLIGPMLTILEKTETKQKARDVANSILGKEKFKGKR
jgi:hypothetical protein